jgi:nucleoside-diphosphate-sugar epimerase
MERLDGRKILIIGGGGFIGHNMAMGLKAQGAEVVVIDGLAVNNYTSLHLLQNNVPDPDLYLRVIDERMALLKQSKVPLVVMDARDYHALSDAVTRIAPDTIIHLAAVSHANRSNKDPYSTFDHSLRTLENALDAARSKGSPVQHFIYFSSSMVYGHFNGQAVSEDTHCEPLGIYGALKFAGEKMVIAYNQVFDLPYTIIRPSALYGERCISRRVIQIFIENAVMGKDITINGDGSDALDFTYIGDLVNGIEKVLTSNRSKGEVFNLTYGSARSLADIAELLQQEFPELKVNYNPKDNLTPDRGTLKVDKARELIGYEPEYPVDLAVPKYVDWYRQMLGK